MGCDFKTACKMRLPSMMVSTSNLSPIWSACVRMSLEADHKPLRWAAINFGTSTGIVLYEITKQRRDYQSKYVRSGQRKKIL